MELTGPCVLSLAGYVLGITMMVIIIVIGAGIVLGYTYKRSVASFLGMVRERKLHKIKPDSFVAFFRVEEGRYWMQRLGSSFHQVTLDKPSSLVPLLSPSKPDEVGILIPHCIGEEAFIRRVN